MARDQMGPAYAQPRYIKLRTGVIFFLDGKYSAGDSANEFMTKLRPSDHLQLCYAPLRAKGMCNTGCGGRSAIVGDVEDNDYIYTWAFTQKAWSF
jgi:hypothetical protein